MSTSKVTVLTPNGRRQTVKVVPSTTILQILEEACTKHGFNPEDYGLIHHKRTLDLTLMFRYAGLPNNCLLEMIEVVTKREDTEVTVCMQLEDGSRLQGCFKPSELLSSVIAKLCPDQMEATIQPVVIYMHNEIFGDAIKTTSLKNLGITTGRAMLRLVHKNPEDLKSQANVYIPVVKKTKVDEEDVPKKEHSVETNKPARMDDTNVGKPQPEAVDSNMQTDKDVLNEKMDVDQPKEYDWGHGEMLASKGNKSEENTVSKEEESPEPIAVLEEEPQIIEIGERNAILYNLEDMKKVESDIADSFFDLTVQDIQTLLQDLKKQTEDMENAPLLTKELRELEDKKRTLNKLAQYKNSVIRIQFPNRYVLQGKFSPVEKVETIYDFVRKFLEDPNTNFDLFTTPPKKILPLDLTLVEADYVPTAVLHFGVEGANDDEEYLKPELQSKLTSPNGAILAASRLRGIDTGAHVYATSSPDTCEPGPSKGAVPKQPENFRPSSVTQQPSGDIPKWFRPSGK